MSAAVVTDSNAQLPAELVERHGITVVPIPVTIDGETRLEGVDLDADGFFACFEHRTPVVTTSQPSPGDFTDVYRALARAGHDRIGSVHVAKALSGTLNSARLAAEMVDVPVELVDTGTASFGVGCCALAVAESLEAGSDVDAAVEIANRLAQRLYSVTAVGVAELLVASGRAPEISASGSGVDVFRSGPGGTFDVVGTGTSVGSLCDLMADTMSADGAPIRVALAIGDAGAAPYYEGLQSRLEVRPDVVEIMRYRIGPSVAAFTGPGTAGGFWHTI